MIDSFKRDGSITSASVYLQDFKRNDWINYNETERFNPGSLFKLPMLITYLRMNEANPGLLDSKMIFDTPFKDFYKDMTIRGVLTDKLDEEMFRKPNLIIF